MVGKPLEEKLDKILRDIFGLEYWLWDTSFFALDSKTKKSFLKGYRAFSDSLIGSYKALHGIIKSTVKFLKEIKNSVDDTYRESVNGIIKKAEMILDKVKEDFEIYNNAVERFKYSRNPRTVIKNLLKYGVRGTVNLMKNREKELFEEYMHLIASLNERLKEIENIYTNEILKLEFKNKNVEETIQRVVNDYITGKSSFRKTFIKTYGSLIKEMFEKMEKLEKMGYKLPPRESLPYLQ